jgi:hypothetical protein
MRIKLFVFVTLALCWHAFPHQASAQTINCASQDGGRQFCPADTRGGVTMVRQNSNSPCIQRANLGLGRPRHLGRPRLSRGFSGRQFLSRRPWRSRAWARSGRQHDYLRVVTQSEKLLPHRQRQFKRRDDSTIEPGSLQSRLHVGQ